MSGYFSIESGLERGINPEIFEVDMKEMWEKDKNRIDRKTLEQFWDRTKLSSSRRSLLDKMRDLKAEEMKDGVRWPEE